MLNATDVAINIAVRDLSAARRFYEETLGLPVISAEGEELIALRSGSSTILLYRSEHAGTNQATAMTWTVDDVDAAVRDLQAKGIVFERYELPGLTHTGAVHVGGDMRVAWFKDPDGNILCLASR